MEEYPLKLRKIVLNTRTPIVLRNFKTQWKCRGETLQKWCERFDQARNEELVEFEQMPIKSATGHPQWERERQNVKINMKKFLEMHDNRCEEVWTGLNYKTPQDIPNECKENINFSCFGFPNLLEEYARFWLSSASANTPCHYDTYGCNVVVQVYGRKSWLLFPPKTPLTTTRIPYEESSIYCFENFYAPTPQQKKELMGFQKDAYICQLNAGDALIIPRHWWHYVETIETSLSVNAWIPLEVDAEAQLHECIVKYLIETIARQENSSALSKCILNPNQDDLSEEESVLNILAFLSDTDAVDAEKKEKSNTKNYAYQYLDEEKVRLLMEDFPNASYVDKAKESVYTKLLDCNSNRFVGNDNEMENSSMNPIKEALINSICSENCVREIADEFRTRFHRTFN